MVKSLAVGDEGSLLTPVWTVVEVVVALVVADGVPLFVMFACSIGQDVHLQDSTCEKP